MAYERIECRGHRFPPGEWAHVTGDDIEVAGIPHRRDAALAFAADVSWCDRCGKDYGLRFEREPTNLHDRNAIKIIGFSSRRTMLGLSSPNDYHVGYVPAELAAELVTEYYDKQIPVGCEICAIWTDDDYIGISFFPLRPRMRRSHPTNTER